MDLKPIVSLSNRYGRNPAFVLAGGGNTSVKEGDVMYVKASGTRLATITEDGFVPVRRSGLRATMSKDYPSSDREREAAFLQDVQKARILENETRRPSVEALLHALFPQRYVLHLHPTKLNGLTCGQDGEAAAKRLFGDDILWIPLCRPGYILGKLCFEAMSAFHAKHGKDADQILLQNHGVFVAGETVDAVEAKFQAICSAVSAVGIREPELTPETRMDPILGARIAGSAGYAAFVQLSGPEFVRLCKDRRNASPLLRPFTPDHIVACGAYPAWVEDTADLSDVPGHRFAAVKGIGVFCLGEDTHSAETVASMVRDAAGIAAATESFGGPLPMTEDLTDFITHWEAESYRRKKF